MRSQGFCAAVLALAVLLTVLPCGQAAEEEGDRAQITLHAKWQGTPLLHEAAEFLADEDPELFWKLATSWAPPANAGQQQCWEALQAAGAAHLSPNMAKVFSVSLALRQYSAKLEMLHQLAAESRPDSACCWAVVGGQVVTDPSLIATAAAAASAADASAGDGARVYAFDHLYRGSRKTEVNASDPSTVPAVLYAPLGSACGAAFHTALSAAAEARPQLAYAWRPHLGEGCGTAEAGACVGLGTEGRLVLPGYGVEMAIKNMEYNARDDSKDSNKEGENGSSNGGAPAPAKKEHKTLEVAEVGRLGLQAASRIRQAEDPLAALQHLSQDFPGVVEELSLGPVDPGLRQALAAMQAYLPTRAHFLLLNGLVYSLQDFNLYELLDVIRKEVRLHDMLRAAGLPARHVREAAMLRGRAADSEGPPRLALASDDFIAWVNNLETDDRYASWHTSLQSLLMPMFPGRLPQIGRNLFTAIYAFDPGSPTALDIGTALLQMFSQNWPIRFGLLPVVPALADKAARPGGTATAAAAADGSGEEGNEDDSSAATAAAAADAATHSEQMGRLLTFVAQSFGAEYSLRLLAEVRAAMPPAQDEEPGFEQRQWEQAERVFTAQYRRWAQEAGTPKARTAGRLPPQTALQRAVEGVSSGAEVLPFLEGAASLALSTGIAGKARGGGVLVFNGVILANDMGSWRHTTVQGLQSQLGQVQDDIYMQRLSDDADDLYEEILSLHGSIPRYNPRILPLDPRGPRYIRISGESDDYEARQHAFTGPLLGKAALAALELQHFTPKGSSDDSGLIPVTHLVVFDPVHSAGIELALSAMQHAAGRGRVGLVLNPSQAAAEAEAPEQLPPLVQLLLAAATGRLELSAEALHDLLTAVLQQKQQPAGLTAAQLQALSEDAIDVGAVLKRLDPEELSALAARHAAFAQQGLGLAPGTNAAVSNGRVVEATAEDEIAPQDFYLMELYADQSQHARQLADVVEAALEAGALPEDAEPSDIIMIASSILAAMAPEDVDPRSGRLALSFASLAQQPHSLSLQPRSESLAEGEAPLFFQAVVDPLSKPAQRLAPLLSFLRQAFDPEMQLVLNPVTELKDLPLKTFYRYALPALGDAPPENASAVFTGLPAHQTLTLGMDVPEPWLVEPVQAEHDLDNLVMDDLGPSKSMTAEFELEALLITGTCLDVASMQARIQDQIHPRGVQLQLGTAAQPNVVDTLVMSNLGYFQLKASPGVWQLGLAPGRSRELYTVASSTGASNGEKAEALAAAPGALEVPVALTSFSGKHMYLFLRKHADRLHEDVLQAGPEESGGSVWGKLSSLAGIHKSGGSGSEAGGALAEGRGGGGDDDRIHVFTVASGHMYERLQKIMILSVIKRTPARVKFWFIKNYMSPQMKAFVPYMAHKYGFDYEFVTYKWPSWLHKQTEKQRIIWAYKILFLDVLFPLGLKKVIFCDSDQVVRADLRELWNMDLQGAPYGYTPFCDNNADMEGFRFWKQGFWAEHLQGKPYHISALYVVDLERFRQMAAGDRLRVMYDALSKDPNSLSNLDQDLPNYAQATVPIFSLPQEWLWCETWCGNATRPQAKTIDLCNNPLTKEPKLQSARRIIAEWPDLNREAEEFTALVGRVQGGGLTEEELLADSSAFRTYLQPMVEGSVRTSGGLAPQAEAEAGAEAEGEPAAAAAPEGSSSDTRGGCEGGTCSSSTDSPAAAAHDEL